MPFAQGEIKNFEQKGGTFTVKETFEFDQKKGWYFYFTK